MPSKFLVPFEVPDFQGTLSSTADAGYVLLFIKYGWLTSQQPDGTQTDLVLRRPLENFTQDVMAEPVTEQDTVLSAIEKIQKTLSNIRLSGDVTGVGTYDSGELIIETTGGGGIDCTELLNCEVITDLDGRISTLENTPQALAATELDTYHFSGYGTQYEVGDLVYYQGHVYRAIATNDGVTPTIGGNSYWADLGAGYRLRQIVSDWNATTGEAQILNKPTALSEFTNDAGFITSYTEEDTLDSVTTRGSTTTNGVTIDGTVNLITGLGTTSVLRIGHTDTPVAFVDIRPSYAGPGTGLYVQNPGVTGNSYTIVAQAQQNNASTNNIAGYFNAQYGATNTALRTDYGNNLLNALGGNLLVGTTTDAGYKFDVNGTARVKDGLTVSDYASVNTSYSLLATTGGSNNANVFGVKNGTVFTAGTFQVFDNYAQSYYFYTNKGYYFIPANSRGPLVLDWIYAGGTMLVAGGNTNVNNGWVSIKPTFDYNGVPDAGVKFIGLYYSPTNYAGLGSQHFAILAEAGKVQLGDLSGSGTRMVVADANGVLSTNVVPSLSESDPVFSASAASSITTTDIDNWNTTYGWGDHNAVGYLTSFTESDPVFTASIAYNILQADVDNWNTAYGWGNHATAGYLTSFVESDTLNTVTNRGNSTANSVSIGSARGYLSVFSGTSVQIGRGGVSGAQGLLQIMGGTDGNSQIDMYRASSVAGYLITALYAAGIGLQMHGLNGIRFTTSGSAVTHIFNDGNVALGYASPTNSGERLDVNGTAKVSGNVTLSSLVGTGSRMVVADATGLLSTQTIPTGNPGTVESVGLTTGSAGNDIGVTGSPITTSGSFTLNIPSASLTARGVVTTGTQTFAGEKTFYSYITKIDSNQGTTVIQGYAQSVLQGAIHFGMYFQFDAYAAASQGFLWKNSASQNILALAQSGEMTVLNLAGASSRMVVADTTGKLSTQPIPVAYQLMGAMAG